MQFGLMLYEAVQLTEQVAEASAILFAMIVLFGSLAVLFCISRFDYPLSTNDLGDGNHGLCNGCWTERWDLKELHCRPCRERLETEAW